MKRITTIGLAGLALMAAGTASAQEFRATNFLPPPHPITITGFDQWSEDIAALSDGRLTFQVFNGGSLVPGAETMDAVGSGVAQVGFIVSVYTPSKLPLGNSVAHFAWEYPDKYVLAGAYADWMLNDPAASQEWIDANTIYGMGFSTPVYHLLCNKPVHNVSEAAGIRVRTPGAAYPGFVEAIGGVSVSMSISEAYDAMDKGALDCVAADITQLTAGANLLDQVTGVTLVPMGPSFIGAAQVYNLDWWRSLSDEDRRNVMTAAARSMARQQIMYTEAEADAMTQATAAGVEIIEPDETLKTAMADYIAGGLGAIESAKTYGVENPEEIFESFRPYLEKWVDLVGNMKDRGDVDELTALFSEKLYDLVDVTTYGQE